MKKWAVAAVIGLSLVGLTACGKEIDVKATNAKLVPGTNDLWYMCHKTTLIYFEKYNGDDSYEAFFAWGCNPDGTMADAFIDPTREGQGNQEAGK
jgi:hypothetical protein